LIGPRTRLLAVSQLSNVTRQPGSRCPSLVAQWQRLHDALTVIDGAQGVVHGRHDVQALGCDFYVFSSHKLYGPDGLGVLFGRQRSARSNCIPGSSVAKWCWMPTTTTLAFARHHWVSKPVHRRSPA
jgi:selenocysteine lyase/cysteine desulfurase